MSILDIFRKTDNTEITDLKSKIDELETTIEKSLNSDLAGIVGNSFITLGVDKGDYYKKNYIIYRGINLLSENIASLPMKLFRNETELPIDHTFPNGFSMKNPHPQMSLNELLYSTCIYLFYAGEFIQHIIVNDGIFRLQPVNPKKIERNKNNTWKYDNKLIIPNEELIYSSLFNPDGDRGLSPIDIVTAELKNDAAAGNYNTKFFENFAKVGGALVDKEGVATREDMQKLVAQFNLSHQSSDKAYKTVGFPKGIEYQELAQTMREMEFLESRKDIRDRILIVLGIHKALVGITDQVNRSVAEEAGRQMWAQTLKPAAKKLQEEYNRQLFNRYFPGYHIQFDFSEITELQENMESLLKQAEELKKLGYTLNEINQHLSLGMEDISDPIGDTRFVPNYLIPFDDMFIGDVGSEKSIKESSIDKIVSIMDKTTTIDKRNTNYINRYNRVQRTIEKRMHGKFGRYFSDQLGKVLSIVNGKKAATVDINTLLAEIQNLINDEKQTLTTITKPLYEEGSIAASKLALVTIGNEGRAIVNNAVVESMTNKITNINNYTYKLIRNEVKASVLEGEAMNKLSKRIINVYKFQSSRSKIIARTESGSVVSRTTNETYKEKGVKKKIWSSAGDAAVRPTHAENHAAGEVNYNHVYSNGMSYPFDPVGGAGEIVCCRCCLIPGGFS